MGQQQLILLVLATVIVGVAIVVGIRAFTENSAKSNADAMTQEAVRIANDMQAWKKKPAPFGGQGSVTDNANVQADNNFTGVTWELLGLASTDNGVNDQGDDNPDTYDTLNGSYEIQNEASNPLIVGRNAAEGNIIEVRICGMRDGDVRGGVQQLAEDDDSFAGAPDC